MGTIIAIDSSAAMIKEASQVVRAAYLTNISVKQMDAGSLGRVAGLLD